MAQKTRIRSHILALFMAMLLGNIGSLALAHDPPVNLSCYETFIGLDCRLSGQPGTCGVTFSGWIGGDGPIPGGWEPFPGDFQGLWTSRVDLYRPSRFWKDCVYSKR